MPIEVDNSICDNTSSYVADTVANEHKVDHPYPSRTEKADLANKTGLSVEQIVHWMSNVRKRRLIPLLR